VVPRAQLSCAAAVPCGQVPAADGSPASAHRD
jgi:hypothetical protein